MSADADIPFEKKERKGNPSILIVEPFLLLFPVFNNNMHKQMNEWPPRGGGLFF